MPPFYCDLALPITSTHHFYNFSHSAMIRLTVEIPEALVQTLEDYFCEFTGVSPWCLFNKDKEHPWWLHGYFESQQDASNQFADLRASYQEIPANALFEEIEDADWQNAYKAFLKPWTSRGLHWVPAWMRDEYPVPQGEVAVYLDAGMAFGTGSHETTRLCAERMLDYRDQRGGDVADVAVIDAGCGTGILAISARLLGFGEIYGFDRDPEAERVSKENLSFNSLDAASIEFSEAGLEDGLTGRKTELLLANIQADVLMIYAENLLDAVRAGGVLVLSGILAREVDSVREKFESTATQLSWAIAHTESTIDGDWCDLVFWRG